MASKIFLLSAPSGSGKTTLVNAVLPLLPKLKRVITHTTRKPRTSENEQPGIDYHFVSDQEFDAGIEDGAFLEWQKIYAYKYGTSYKAIREVQASGKHPLLVIDVDGAAAVRKKENGEIFSIYLDVSLDEICSRLAKRKEEDPEEIARRLARYEKESKNRYDFDCVLVNDRLEKAAENFVLLIEAFS